MRQTSVLILCASLVLLGLFSDPTHAGPITNLSFNQDPVIFRFSIEVGEITADTTRTFSFGGFWDVNITIQECERCGPAGFVDEDVITLSATARHNADINPASGQSGGGQPATLNLRVGAGGTGDFPPFVFHTVSNFGEVETPHGFGKDVIDGNIFARIAHNPGHLSETEITSYRLGVVGFDAPEPSTFAMLSTGLLVLLGYGWKRRKTG